VDIGSSFLPSEIISAFLYAQLEMLDVIQKKRISIWGQYYNGLKMLEEKGVLRLPFIPDYATNNGHLFFIVCGSHEERAGLMDFLKRNDINSVFHYLSLHKSPFYKDQYQGAELPNCELFSDRLLRLPMFYELSEKEVDFVVLKIKEFYGFA